MGIFLSIQEVYMKKIMTMVLATLSFQVFADAFIPYTTEEEAAKNCPSSLALTFKAANSTPNSAGLVESANSDNTFFKSLQTVVRPDAINENGYIADASLRDTNGMYGYNSNSVITCFYTYRGINKQNVFLNLRSVN